MPLNAEKPSSYCLLFKKNKKTKTRSSWNIAFICSILFLHAVKQNGSDGKRIKPLSIIETQNLDFILGSKPAPKKGFHHIWSHDLTFQHSRHLFVLQIDFHTFLWYSEPKYNDVSPHTIHDCNRASLEDSEVRHNCSKVTDLLNVKQSSQSFFSSFFFFFF